MKAGRFSTGSCCCVFRERDVEGDKAFRCPLASYREITVSYGCVSIHGARPTVYAPGWARDFTHVRESSTQFSAGGGCRAGGHEHGRRLSFPVCSQRIPHGFNGAFQSWFLRASAKTRLSQEADRGELRAWHPGGGWAILCSTVTSRSSYATHIHARPLHGGVRWLLRPRL